MALEGPSFSSFIRFVLLTKTTSITIGLVLYQRGFLLNEVIGLGIMVCVTFDHYNLWIYASASFCFWRLLGSYINPLDHVWGDWQGVLASLYPWVLVCHWGDFWRAIVRSHHIITFTSYLPLICPTPLVRELGWSVCGVAPYLVGRRG